MRSAGGIAAWVSCRPDGLAGVALVGALPVVTGLLLAAVLSLRDGFVWASAPSSALVSVLAAALSCLALACLALACFALPSFFVVSCLVSLFGSLTFASGLAAGLASTAGAGLARGSLCASAAELPKITAKIAANGRMATPNRPSPHSSRKRSDAPMMRIVEVKC